MNTNNKSEKSLSFRYTRRHDEILYYSSGRRISAGGNVGYYVDYMCCHDDNCRCLRFLAAASVSSFIIFDTTYGNYEEINTYYFASSAVADNVQSICPTFFSSNSTIIFFFTCIIN